MIQQTETQQQTLKVRHPISVRLITFISLLVIIALGAITAMVTYFVSNDTRVTAEDNNFTVNQRTASVTQNKFDSVKSNVYLLLDMLATESVTSELSEEELAKGGSSARFFFERSDDIVFVCVPGFLSMKNEKFLNENRIDAGLCDSFIAQSKSVLNKAVGGANALGGASNALQNATAFFGSPLMALFSSVSINGEDMPLAIVFSTQNLNDSYGTGMLNSSYLVNLNGDVLLYSDVETLKGGANFMNEAIVLDLPKVSSENKQSLYTDSDGSMYFGAFTKLADYGCAVITKIPYETVFNAVQSTMWRNIYLSLAVLAIVILFIWFWSKSVSTPIKQLAKSALEIGKGNYDQDFSEIKANKKDELGILKSSFGVMNQGLREREHLKDAFSKFSNKEIAEKAARGELTLGGETKNVTIFFSDIRSFTAMSEKLTPEEVVSFLNDYMTRMVRCVNATGGVVDKYIGDAVMAVWGSPLSAGSPAEDAFNCVKSALMMRSELIQFNRERVAKGLGVVKIGCGINTGSVVAGQIGSEERMEYTVIGDAVNLASRTESLNKPFQTDILITENTYELIKEKIVVEEMPGVTVKGKSAPLKMFAVVNTKEDCGVKLTGSHGPKSLNQIRKVLGFEIPDLAKVNADEDEKKYKIQGQ